MMNFMLCHSSTEKESWLAERKSGIQISKEKCSKVKIQNFQSSKFSAKSSHVFGFWGKVCRFIVLESTFGYWSPGFK